MFETLFGADVPLAVRFFIAFVVVLGLIGAAAWAVRRFGANRLGANATRGRQPRLAVIDAAAVDGRRRLVLIRRDNVEHLVMIGGPTDIVIEPSIVRASAPQRDAPPVRAPGAGDAAARPLPENGQWPLQPEPAPAPRPLRAPASSSDETIPWPLPSQPDQAARAHRTVDTLVGLADQLSVRPARDPSATPSPRPAARPPEPRIAEPRIATPAAAAAAAAPSAEPTLAAAEKNLADMAHRLEAALRRPSPAAEPRSSAPAPQPPRQAEPITAMEPIVPTLPPGLAGSETGPEQPEPPKPAPGKSLYDSLEQEMANLLGRPPGKP